jgi:hypothetical protein
MDAALRWEKSSDDRRRRLLPMPPVDRQPYHQIRAQGQPIGTKEAQADFADR